LQDPQLDPVLSSAPSGSAISLEEELPPYLGSLMDHLMVKMANASDEDRAFARKAFYTAFEWHKPQKRKSGEPYFMHPYEVALILTELNASGEMIAAGFLHDVLEDTDYGAERMREEFGEVVLQLVDGVTKLSQFSFSSKEERQAENFRRMFIAMAKDIRVVIIKLADRLHNMRTLDHMKEEKQRKIAQETLDIFAPLAHRLGIGRLKWELEDLCLRYLHPDYYWSIAKYLAQKRTEREEVLKSTISQITEAVKRFQPEEVGEQESGGVKPKKFEIIGRPKNFFSIYNKLSKKQKDFKDSCRIRYVYGSIDNKKEIEDYEPEGNTWS
jgi:GTP pyrophosphokinase